MSARESLFPFAKLTLLERACNALQTIADGDLQGATPDDYAADMLLILRCDPEWPRAARCPDCWKGKPMPCAGGCREWNECCGKKLDGPCERCEGTGVLRAGSTARRDERA